MALRCCYSPRLISITPPPKAQWNATISDPMTCRGYCVRIRPVWATIDLDILNDGSHLDCFRSPKRKKSCSRSRYIFLAHTRGHRVGEYIHARVTHIQVLLNHERRRITREGLDSTTCNIASHQFHEIAKLPQLLQHDHKFSTQLRFRSLRVSDMAGLSYS